MDRECGQGLEWREAEEVEWGDVLRVSQRGMWASRGFLWEEAARNVACLLACPAAWDGDHFLQVSRRPPEYSIFFHNIRLSLVTPSQRIDPRTASPVAPRDHNLSKETERHLT